MGGWTGESCGVDSDECVSAPCLNGGTCTDEVAAFVCTCVDGWVGVTDCNTSVDPCALEEDTCDAVLAECTHTGPGTHECL